MKKIICMTMAMVLTLTLAFSASAATTMYAPDGRTANVNDYDVQAWKNVGWYDYPVATVYAPDGRTAVISKNAVWSWKNVGWYDYPVATVYAPDGRTAVISRNAVQSWKSVGWYDYPVVTVYAPDGRTAVIAKSALQSWLNVGWYENRPVTIYNSYTMSTGYYTDYFSGETFPTDNYIEITNITENGFNLMADCCNWQLHIGRMDEYFEFISSDTAVCYGISYAGDWYKITAKFKGNTMTLEVDSYSNKPEDQLFGFGMNVYLSGEYIAE